MMPASQGGEGLRFPKYLCVRSEKEEREIRPGLLSLAVSLKPADYGENCDKTIAFSEIVILIFTRSYSTCKDHSSVSTYRATERTTDI